MSQTIDAGAAAAAAEAKKNLKAEHRSLIATVRNDITIPYYNGVLQPLDDTLLQRGGGKGLKIYDEIERDTHAWSVLAKRRNELTAREWIVEPASKDAADVETADFVTGVLKGLPFDRVCQDLLDANLKGFAVCEIVWMRDARGIVPERIVAHDQRRFAFDEDWRLRLLTREAMREGVLLPDRKMIVHRVGVKGNNPYGLGLGTRLFWPVYFKREGVAFWLTYLDKYASPTPIGKTPVGLSPDEQRQILLALENLAQSRGITVPIGTELAFLEATRSGPISYEAWERYWDEQMSVCVLGETLSTVMGSVGSLAAANVHTEGKSQLVDSDGDLLADTLQETLVRWLVDYNRPGRQVPRVVRLRPKNEEALGKAREQIAKAEKAEIEAFGSALRLVDGMVEADALATLRLVSALAARMDEAALKAILSQPRPRAPAEPTPGKPPAPEEGEDPEPDGDAYAFAAPADVLGRPHFPEAVFEAFEAALLAPIGEWMRRFQAAIGVAETLDDVSDRVLELSAELPIDELAARLGDAIVFTELLGRQSVVAEAEEDGVDRSALFADAGPGPGIVFEGAPMAEAMQFLRDKVALPQTHWSTLAREGHDRAFVVAGNLRADVAADLQAMVIRNLEKGRLAGFRAEFDALLASGKWTGDPDLLTNDAKRAWRTKTIYMTNLSTAHAAGRLKQQRALIDVLPFWQYRHGATRTPKRPRQPHLRLNGLTLPADDKGWARIYPPNGWLCSCAVRAITAAAAGRADPTLKKAPLPFEIDRAVDAHWQYMPGHTWERGLVPPEERRSLDVERRRPRKRRRSLEELSLDRPFVSGSVAGKTDAEAVAAFLAEFGAAPGRAVLFRDVAGQQVLISRELFEDKRSRTLGADGLRPLKTAKPGHLDYILQMAETIKDPDEIWVDYRDGAIRRTYIRGGTLDAGGELIGLSAFGWSTVGWEGLTAFAPLVAGTQLPRRDYVEELRHGALLYRAVRAVKGDGG